jgi:pyruvate formate lyase activating enzyme
MPQPGRCLQCGACTAACPHHAAVPAALAESVAPAVCSACGACSRACPSGARELVGRASSVNGLLDLIERDRIFYDESGGGVTFSGGEPLLQPVFLLGCIQACRAAGMHVAVDTCGLADPDVLLTVARETDLFLFDLKLVDEERHLAFTGSSNRRILSNLELLAGVHPQIVVRLPLIPGVNSSDADVRAIGALLAALGLNRIDVLPYHRAGLAKYERLHRPYALGHVLPPTAALQAHVARLLESFGLTVRPGGSS